MSTPTFSVAELAAALDLPFSGQGDELLTGLAPLASAKAGELSFLANVKYKSQLSESGATAVIVHPSMQADCPASAIIADNPYLAYARASALFDPWRRPAAGVHASAVVLSSKVHPSAAIGANCVIEEGAEIGEGTVVGPGTVIGADAKVGKHCLLHANVTLYHKVVLGDHCVIHSGVVIGADGFGFAPSPEGWVKVHQIGSVRIGSRVEIGACSSIDRGAITDTILGDGVILDDQILIAHNVEIGSGTAMAGGCQVAGSTKIGKNCTFGGSVGVLGHLQIADNVHVTARSLVAKSLTEAGAYSSGVSAMESSVWRKSMARLGRLDELFRRVLSLEKSLKNEEGKS